MENISRRGFLKTAATVVGGLVITSSVKGNEIDYDSRKDLTSKTIDDLKPAVGENPLSELSEEDLKKRGENLRKYTQLSEWMGENEEKIFAKASNNELYAVGIWRKEMPEIHYFNNKLGEVLPFMIKSNEKGEINHFIYRYQKDIILMF